MHRRSLAALCLSLLALVVVAVATPASAASGNSRTAARAAGTQAVCVPTAGRFYNRWQQDPGGYGCAVGYESSTGNGTYQNFERGQMVWSPSQGGGMIVSGRWYTYWTDWGLRYGAYFVWGQSDPFNYDSWLVRLDRNSANLGQWECWATLGCTRTNGGWAFSDLAPGYAYRFVVEGCDVGSSHTCRQGWTIPVWIWF